MKLTMMVSILTAMLFFNDLARGFLVTFIKPRGLQRRLLALVDRNAKT